MTDITVSQETIDDLYFQIAELTRKLACLIRPGTVKSFDPAAGGKAVLDVGFDTDPRPVAAVAGSAKHWSPLSPGQQVALLCPDGDPALGVVVPWGYQDAVTPPSNRIDEEVIARGTAALRVREGGTVHAVVADIPSFKIIAGGQAWSIKPDALIPADDS